MKSLHEADWPETREMLRRAVEHYSKVTGRSKMWVLGKIADSMPPSRYSSSKDGLLSIRTIERDMKEADKEIPYERIEQYVKWFWNAAGTNREWIDEWLEYTDYPRPGELLALTCDLETNNKSKLYESVKINLDAPSLGSQLSGGAGIFLGRQKELEWLRFWADESQSPIAVLWGFGGNGKSTLQLYVKENFVFCESCKLRRPFMGAIWISALNYPHSRLGLAEILRKIAETYGLLQKIESAGAPESALRIEVKRILRKERILVLLDNFETILSNEQLRILEYFNSLGRHAPSRLLISSRHDMNRLPHLDPTQNNTSVAITKVDGLSVIDAQKFVEKYQKLHLVENALTENEINDLVKMTYQNPKVMILALGAVTRGISPVHLLSRLRAGDHEPAVEEVFERIIGEVWMEILDEPGKKLLMTKALFGQSVHLDDLCSVAGISKSAARKSLDVLQAISFFEYKHAASPHGYSKKPEMRIDTHPLAQGYCVYVLRNDIKFLKEIEKRWWDNYAPKVVKMLQETSYETAEASLMADLLNVIEHFERHLLDEHFQYEPSPYKFKAAKLFGSERGIGPILFRWGKWDEMLRISKIVLDIAIKEKDPKLIGYTALKLIGYVHNERYEFEKASEYIEIAFQQNRNLRNIWLDAMIAYARASVLRKRGFYNEAEKLYLAALQRFIELNDFYQIGEAYLWLGGNMVDIADRQLNEPVDKLKKVESILQQAEQYFSEARCSWEKLDDADPLVRTDKVSAIAWSGVIERIRGNLDKSRALFKKCFGEFPSMLSVARLYYELALVEHLDGNIDFANEYERRGSNLCQSVTEIPPTYRCYLYNIAKFPFSVWY